MPTPRSMPVYPGDNRTDAEARAAWSAPIDVPADAPATVNVVHVRITVTGDCGHVLGIYMDTISEKYPFYCEKCEDYNRTGSYPWEATTEILITQDPVPEVAP